MKTPQEVLLKAADIIEKDGWFQGSYYKEPEGMTSTEDDIRAARTAPVCSLGAIHRAVYGAAWPGIEYVEDELRNDERLHFLNNDAVNHFKAYLITRYDEVYGVPSWNDEDGRTAEEVTRAMRGAAAIE